MKLKTIPEDFFVEELPFSFPTEAARGEYSFYRLEKKNWTTPDALSAVRRRWEIPMNRMGWGGLKDRHAHTIQYFSVYRGPRRGMEHSTFTVEYLGVRDHPYSTSDFYGNRFKLILRDLQVEERASLTSAFTELEQTGVVNYFDDQRFGSVTDGRSFIAREMVMENYEGALKLALCGEYAYDPKEAREEKETLRKYWNEWTECRAHLERGHARSLVCYMQEHPLDFKGAVLRLRPELQGLYLSAWQSHLWNRMVSRALETRLPASQLTTLKLKTADVVTPKRIPAEQLEFWEKSILPLVSARLKPQEGAWWTEVVDTIMKEEGVELAKMKIRGADKPFFSRGERSISLRPSNVTWAIADDERHRNRQKMKLEFELPRGAYATMVVKFLHSATGTATVEEEPEGEAVSE